MGVSPFRPTSGQSYEDDITQSQGLTKATPIHPNLKKKTKKKKQSNTKCVVTFMWLVMCSGSCSSWKMTKKKHIAIKVKQMCKSAMEHTL